MRIPKTMTKKDSTAKMIAAGTKVASSIPQASASAAMPSTLAKQNIKKSPQTSFY